MAKKPLIDTELLVDYLRELPAAVSYLESVKGDLVTSAIVVAELHAGVREGEERTALGQLLSLIGRGHRQ